MPLINCKVNLELTWSKNCVTTNSTGEGKFQIRETKLYVLIKDLDFHYVILIFLINMLGLFL